MIGKILLYESSNLGLIDKIGDLNESELKELFAKYNGSGEHAKEYGNNVYKYYTAFKEYNNGSA
jgi:hypothetical protein